MSRRDPREQLARRASFLGGGKGTNRQACCLQIDRSVGLDAFHLRATVRVREFVRRSIKPLEDERRMAAILEGFDVWATWLDEGGSAAAKALLKTAEGMKRTTE